MSLSETPSSPETPSKKHWLIILIGVVIVAALTVSVGVFLMRTPLDHVPPDPERPPDGQQLYASMCASCHGADGQGVPGRNPPLAGTDLVVGDPDLPVLVVLHGMRGPVEVRGQTYDGLMPRFGQHLSNSEVAAVVTYIRSAWGNDAPPVSTAQVLELREAHDPTRASWTAEELGER